MSAVRSFPPIADASSRVLILGSMPGKASLEAGEYYAHPRNAFWPITGAVLDFDAQAPYDERTAVLLARGVALWDVLESCVRPTSMDADIDEASIVVNDFHGLLERSPGIERICFNGTKAAQSFARYVAEEVGAVDAIEQVRLPSTSPANASIPYPRKLAAWREALA